MHTIDIKAAFLGIFLTSSLVLVNAFKTERDLRDYLMIQHLYDKHVRPVRQPSTVVPVQLQIVPLILREVDDAFHRLTLDTWLIVQWKDEYLQWDPVEYGGLQEFRLPVSEVWAPDLSVYTGTPDTSLFPTVRTNVVINYQGEVLWVPPFTFSNRCPEIKFGAVEANCTISLLSWTYDITQLNLNIRSADALEYFENNYPGWNLESITPQREMKTFSCCQQPWPVIHFHVTLKKTD